MASISELDTDGVAQVALLLLDGDRLENVLLDRYGHPDYDFENFNELKKALMKTERVNPSLDLTAMLWQLRPDNPDVALPVVCGGALPAEGWQSCRLNDAQRRAFTGGEIASRTLNGCSSRYYPVRNSNYEIVGVLELLQGDRIKGDI